MGFRVEVESQGHLFKASVRGRLPFGCPGKRKRIIGFSKRSRKNLFDSVTRLEADKVLFVTLTYKDPVPGPSQVKRDLDVFVKRLLRKYPGAAGHWRFGVESGGERIYHPHLHLLIYNLSYIPHSWLERTWSEVTGGLGGFTWVGLKGWRGVVAYVAKYAAKVEERASLEYMTNLTGEEWPGRFWGAFNREHLPLAELVKAVFEFGRWFYGLKRAGRHVWPGVNSNRQAGFTLFRDGPDQWLRLCVFLVATAVSR